MSEFDKKHNTDAHRYEVWVDGELAGFAQYEQRPGEIVFVHTEVYPKFEGKGIGSQIARFGLDDVRAEGSQRVGAQCSFIKVWIEKHPDYQDLLA